MRPTARGRAFNDAPRIRYSRQTIVRTAPAVCAQPVDVPSTLLTGEITALALRVSCAFAFAVNAKLCNAENSATQKTLQRRKLCNAENSATQKTLQRRKLCNAENSATDNVARMLTLGSFAP